MYRSKLSIEFKGAAFAFDGPPLALESLEPPVALEETNNSIAMHWRWLQVALEEAGYIQWSHH